MNEIKLLTIESPLERVQAPDFSKLIEPNKNLSVLAESMQKFKSPLENIQFPDYSKIFAPIIDFSIYAKALQNTMAETLGAFSEQIRSITEGWMINFHACFEELGKSLAQIGRPYAAIEKLGEVQYVYWDFLTDDFIDTIINSNNVNKTLRELNLMDKHAKVSHTLQKCSKHQLITAHKRLFLQAVAAFRNKQYDISIVGLFAVIDGLLTTVSGDLTTAIYKRATAIIAKADDLVIEDAEIAYVALLMTFEKTMESICAKSDFGGKEPKNLNRHWVMHGRSRRRKTQLDCIKLINFIYGLLLINDSIETEVSNNECLG